MISILTGIMLSFDDGISHNSRIVAEMLNENGIVSNFYIVGNTLEDIDNSKTACDIIELGHTICNHTYSHINLTKVSLHEAYKDIALGSLAIKKATGSMPTCFRPPYGATNKSINSFAKLLGMSIDRSLAPGVFDTMDRDPDTDPVQRMSQINIKNYSEILMHDNQDRILEELIYLLSL